MAWLTEPFDGTLPFRYENPPGLPALPTRLHIFAALLGMNGGMTVRGWGMTQSGGLYGRMGLEQDEALFLLQMASFVDGFLLATSNAELPALVEAINLEHARIADLTATPKAP